MFSTRFGDAMRFKDKESAIDALEAWKRLRRKVETELFVELRRRGARHGDFVLVVESS